MSFQDRYAITNIELKDSEQKMSFSIDEFDNIIIPVLLLVPNVKEHEHDHVHFKNEGELKRFLNILKLKGSNYMNTGYYRLETSHHIHENNLLIHLYVYMFKSNNPKDGVDKLYTIGITKKGFDDISDWIDEYYSRNDDELYDKYTKDSKA